MMTSKERGEVAGTAEEVELRMTRAQAVKVNKRKLHGEELSCCSSSLVQLKCRRRIATTGENSDDSCASPSSDHALSSCSSRNASSELAREKLTTSDLKEEDDEASSVEMTMTATHNMVRRGRRETTPLSDLITEPAEMKSTTVRPSQSNSLRPSMASKMPSVAELEDFFSTAEKHLQKQFAEKYNFDITKEEPLEGRYEWFRVKP